MADAVAVLGSAQQLEHKDSNAPLSLIDQVDNDGSSITTKYTISGDSSEPRNAHAQKVSGTAATRARLMRSDTRRMLVADGAVTSSAALKELAAVPRPVYTQWKAVLYGSFIDVAIMLRMPFGGPLCRQMVKHGGPENIRFLLTLASFDTDGDGSIDNAELAAYEKSADTLINDSVAMCGNLALVSALLLGLTHQTTVGRPIPFSMAADAAAFVGPANSGWLLWVAYGFNLIAEGLAFFTICQAVITRNALTNILPTRELRIDMLRTTNALGKQAVSMLLTLWAFLASCICMPLVASTSIGFLATGWFTLIMCACMWFIAPLRYTAMLMLHEEVKRTMANSMAGNSFAAKRRSSTHASGRTNDSETRGELQMSVLGRADLARV